MNFFDKVKSDIKSFKDYDTYITFLIALVLSILNIMGKIESKHLPALTLAVLALLMVSLLKNKFKLDDIAHSLVKKKSICGSFPNDFVSSIEGAKTLDIIGIHHNSLTTDHLDTITRSLQNGGKLRVLLVALDGSAIEMTSLRFASRIPPIEQEKSRAKTSLERFAQLKSDFPGRVLIKNLDYLFEYGAIIADANLPSSKIYVERYTFQHRGGSRKPKLTYTPYDGEWHDLYLKEFDNFWNCPSAKDV